MRNRGLALLVAACFFMENLDGTIVTTALPTIASDLGVPTTDSGLIVTAYLIALAAFIPLGGWLLTRVPGRWLLTGSIAIFTLASLICAVSQTLPVLVLARVLQGAGGALMVPIGRQLVLRDAELKDIQKLIAYIVWPALIAPVIAPVVGGFIVEQWSWHWIFIINIPLGLIAMPIALRIAPNDTDGKRKSLDVAGFLLTASGLGALVWTAHLFSDAPVWWVGLAWATAAVALCAWAIIHLRRSDHPLVELDVFRDRIFACSQAGMFAHSMVVASLPFLLPLLLQTAFGWNPVKAGAMVMFIFAGNIAIKPFTSALLNLAGYKANLVVSSLGLCVTGVALMALPQESPYWLIAAVAFASGVFRSAGFTAVQTIAFATIPQDQRAPANVVASLNQQVAMALGVALATVGLGLGAALSGSASTQTAFIVAGALSCAPTLAAVVAVLMLPANAGDELRTKPKPKRGTPGEPEKAR